MIKNFYNLFFSLFLILSLINCTSEVEVNNPATTYHTISFHSKLSTNWDQVFIEHQVLKFKFPDPNKDFWRLGTMLINSQGEYFIQDGKARQIFHFDPQRNFIRNIGAFGEGPGEYLLGILSFFDKDDNLYVFDIMRDIFTKYNKPVYSYSTQFSLKSSIRGFAVPTNDGEFIDYSLNQAHRELICKFNDSGKIIKRAFIPKDTKFTSFIHRFGLGIINQFPGKGILLVDSQKYSIYLFDYNLNLKKVIQPASSSTYFPCRDSFPKSLSPYSFSARHAKWWEKSLVPSQVKVIVKNNVLVTLLSKFKKYSSRQFVNIHNLKGITFAKGLEVTLNGKIIYVHGDHIYTLVDDNLSKSGIIIPQTIHRYTFNHSILE
jgi:hypothetical protein